MEKTTVVGVDIAKTLFEIAVSEIPGQVSQRKRLPRSGFRECFEELPPSTIVAEACGSAHRWGREFETLGHTVVLLPPHLVKPYITRNKTDRTDAKGILEAEQRRNSSRSDQDHHSAGPWRHPPLPLRMDRVADGPGQHRSRFAARISGSPSRRVSDTWCRRSAYRRSRLESP